MFHTRKAKKPSSVALFTVEQSLWKRLTLRKGRQGRTKLRIKTPAAHLKKYRPRRHY